MLDLRDTIITNLQEVPETPVDELIDALLVGDEIVVGRYQDGGDVIVFTNARLVVVELPRKLGKERIDFTTMPYRRAMSYAVEMVDGSDTMPALELLFPEIGPVRFEFATNTKVFDIGRLIASYIL
jgi:hypothetical protein